MNKKMRTRIIQAFAIVFMLAMILSSFASGLLVLL